MNKIDKILFPVELSPISEKIAPHAAFRAERFGAELHVLHVVPRPESLYVSYGDITHLESLKDQVIAEAEQRLKEFCDQNLLAAKCSVVAGDPFDKILEYIRDQGISQVIMGTHGRHGIDRIVMGSVATRIVRRSPVPVLTVNPYLLEAE